MKRLRRSPRQSYGRALLQVDRMAFKLSLLCVSQIPLSNTGQHLLCEAVIERKSQDELRLSSACNEALFVRHVEMAD